MRLLLLLSALLAALTGGQTGACAPRAEAVVVAVRAAEAAPQPAHAHVLLAVAPGFYVAGGPTPVLTAFVPREAPRLWSQRRRE